MNETTKIIIPNGYDRWLWEPQTEQDEELHRSSDRIPFDSEQFTDDVYDRLDSYDGPRFGPDF